MQRENPWAMLQGGGTPNSLGGGGVDPATGNLASLYAGAQKPWQPAYGMAGYGQGLEMNPYQGGWQRGNMGWNSATGFQPSPYGQKPSFAPGAFGKPSIGYGGGYRPPTGMMAL